ncbi:TPA: hypothetical protein ACSE69_003693, partial [Acinetobacter baumannii]
SHVSIPIYTKTILHYQLSGSLIIFKNLTVADYYIKEALDEQEYESRLLFSYMQSIKSPL